MNKNNNALFTHRIVIRVLVILALLNLGVIFFLPDSDFKIPVSDILFISLNLVTVISLWLPAWHSRKITGKIAINWAILCLAQLVFMFGDLSWAYYEIIVKSNPFPSVADIFYLSYYPLFMIGILLFGFKNGSKTRWINNWLDIGIIFISASLFLGVYLLYPLLNSVVGETVFVQILTFAYPMGDLLLLSALLILIYSRPIEKLDYPVLFIALSILIQIVADIVFSYQSLMETYVSGGWLDSGWVLGYLSLGMAGYYQITQQGSAIRENRNMEPKIITRNRAIAIFRNLLPYLLIISTYLLFFENYRNQALVNTDLLLGGIGVLVILVLTRQILVLYENDRLNTNLNKALDEVSSQATRLQKTNTELLLEMEERIKAETQLAFEALHDSLTLLPNRVLLIDRIKHAIELSKRYADYSFSIFFIDIDEFKNVNDSMGHSVGDELLVRFAERLQKDLRKSDTLARIGGDEFAILLENTSENETPVNIADRIQGNLRPSYNLAGKNFFISASIGIVLDTKRYNDPDTILQDADIAMYRAKALGKARFVVFTETLRSEVVSRLELESQLRDAIDKNEFVLDYQPIYSLGTNSLAGFEALLRWNHPKRGILLPVDFLNVAENSGMIVQIGEWVIFKACLQMKRWHNQFPQYQNLYLNINISGKQFIHPNFIPHLNKVINDTGLKPKNICLEITETVLIENRSLANDIFKSLHKMGFEIQIDDFGTGYSSMGYLQDFPVDTIKIDRTFIRSMGMEEKGSQIVQAIITMAHQMGMNVIAEGIETGEQLHFLQSMSCKFGQGFYLSHPLPSTEIDLLIRSEQHESKTKLQ